MAAISATACLTLLIPHFPPSSSPFPSLLAPSPHMARCLSRRPPPLTPLWPPRVTLCLGQSLSPHGFRHRRWVGRHAAPITLNTDILHYDLLIPFIIHIWKKRIAFCHRFSIWNTSIFYFLFAFLIGNGMLLGWFDLLFQAHCLIIFRESSNPFLYILITK